MGESLTKTHLVDLEHQLPFWQEGTLLEIEQRMDALVGYFSTIFVITIRRKR